MQNPATYWHRATEAFVDYQKYDRVLQLKNKTRRRILNSQQHAHHKAVVAYETASVGLRERRP